MLFVVLTPLYRVNFLKTKENVNLASDRVLVGTDGVHQPLPFVLVIFTSVQPYKNNKHCFCLRSKN